MHILIKDITDNSILAGALAGRKMLTHLLEQVDKNPTSPVSLYLDFRGIEVATASFLRESVFEFRSIVRRKWSNYYPVVANTNNHIIDELTVLLEQRDVLVLCTLDDDVGPSLPHLLGELEPKQQIAFDLVCKLGGAGASELMQSANTTENVGQTAWNNRLSSLSRLGLLMEINQGRAKRYCPLPLEG